MKNAGRLTRAPGAERRFPLSFNQEFRLFALWTIALRRERVGVPHLWLSLRFRGSPDVSALERAVNELVRRHEVLRTAFPRLPRLLRLRPVARVVLSGVSRLMRGRTRNVQAIRGSITRRVLGSPHGSRLRQVVKEVYVAPFVKADISGIAEGQRAGTSRRIVNAEIERPMDISKPPLIRAVLITEDDDHYALLLVAHHLVADLWSMNILQREFLALHRAFAEGKPSPLPERTVHYGDFAVWERAYLRGDELARRVAYWKNHLGPDRGSSGALSVTDLPFALPAPAVPTFLTGSRTLRLEPTVCEELRQLCVREEITPFMAMFATFALALHRCTGKSQITIGSNFANRVRPGTEDLVGWFANGHDIAFRFTPDDRIIDVFAQCRQHLLGAFDHQDIPRELIWRSGDQPQEAMPRLAEMLAVRFDFEFAEAKAVGGGRESRSSDGGGTGPKRAPHLTVRVVSQRDAIRVLTVYPVDRLTESSIDALLGYWRTCIDLSIASPQASVSELPAFTFRPDAAEA